MRNKVKVIIFIIFIYFITILSLFSKDKSFSENENRYLATKPKFTFQKLKDGLYTKEYEEYITDQFILRDKWISIKTYSERFILKKDINGVYFGKDDYLIEKYEGFNEDQVNKNINRLNEFISTYSKKIGENHVKVMIVPTSSEVLKDKLPLFAYDNTQKNLINYINNILPEGTAIDLMDVFEKYNNEYIYYRTDHHWTSLGAYYAYKSWGQELNIEIYNMSDFNIEEVSNDFYGTIYSKVNTKVKADSIHLYSLKDKDIEYKLEYDLGQKVTDSIYDFKKLEGKDKYAVFLGGNNGLVNIRTNVDNNRKLLIIKDSFANSFVPFVINNFSQVSVVDFRYYNMKISEYIEKEDFTDILFLYNSLNFNKDRNLIKLSY